jgi:hypothetical protein
MLNLHTWADEGLLSAPISAKSCMDTLIFDDVPSIFSDEDESDNDVENTPRPTMGLSV